MNFFPREGSWLCRLSLAVCGLALAGPVVQARSIPIVNPSFEQDAIAGPNAPDFETRSSAPTGWHWVKSDTGHVSGLLAPDVRENKWYSGPTPGFDGAQVHFTVAGECPMRQVLKATLQPNTTYTLSVASGTRTNPGFAGYLIDLSTTSGVTVGKWSGSGRNLAPNGTFATTTRSFTTGPNPPGIGQPLQITIGYPADYGPGGYTDLDMVTLDASPAPAHAANTPIDVMIVAGQSNAHGWQSNRAQLSEPNRHYAEAPAANAFLAYTQRNLPDPQDNVGSFGHLGTSGSGFAGNFDGFGPELSLGTDLAKKLDKPIAIIKYAIGSAGLAQNFVKTGPTDPKAAYHLYGPMTAFITEAMQQLRDQGYAPKLKALFWLQGEGDVGTTAYATAYNANMTQFVHDLRTDLSAPTLKVFMTEMNQNMPWHVARAANSVAVNNGMLALSKSDANCYFIPTIEITTGFPDIIHYSADQTVDIGQRWAEAYADLVSP